MKKSILFCIGCGMLVSCGKGEDTDQLLTPVPLTSAPTQGDTIKDDLRDPTPSMEPSALPAAVETIISPTVIPDTGGIEENLGAMDMLKKEYGFTTIGTAGSGWVSVPGVCHSVGESSPFYVREDNNVYYSFVRNRMSLADAREYVLKSIREQYSSVEIEEMSVADYGGTLPGYVFFCMAKGEDNGIQLACLCIKNQDGTATIMLATAPEDYALKEEAAMYVSTYLEPTKPIKNESEDSVSKPIDTNEKSNGTVQVEKGESKLLLGDDNYGFLDLGEGFSYDEEMGKYIEKNTGVVVDLKIYYTDASSLVEAEQILWKSKGFSCSSNTVVVDGLEGYKLTIRNSKNYTVLIFLPLGDDVTEVIEIVGERADVDPIVTDACINYQQPEEFPEVPEIDFSGYQKVESDGGTTKIQVGDTVVKLEGDWYLAQEENLSEGVSITGYTSREGSITITQADKTINLSDSMNNDGFVFDKQSYTDSAGNEVIESKYYLQETGLILGMLDVKLKDSPSTIVHVSMSQGDAASWLMRLFGTIRQQ